MTDKTSFYFNLIQFLTFPPELTLAATKLFIFFCPLKMGYFPRFIHKLLRRRYHIIEEISSKNNEEAIKKKFLP